MRSRARTHVATLLLSAVLASAALAVGGGTAHARAPSPSPSASSSSSFRPPASVDGGAWSSGHLQGTAIDRRRGHMYFSFTNLLVKTDLAGRPIGSVTGLTGHLGDLDFNSADGRVYGSLESQRRPRPSTWRSSTGPGSPG